MCQVCNYVVFEKPTDFPEHYVCRIFHAVQGQPVPEREPYMVVGDIKAIRDRMEELGFVVMERFGADKKQIVEVWMTQATKDLTELGVMMGF